MHLHQEFLAVLHTVSRVDDREWVADCPLHRSCNRKLHIVRTKKHVYVECEDGCGRNDVLAALNIAADDTLSLVCWGKPGRPPPPRRPSFWAKARPMLPLPSGDIYDLWPHPALVDEVMTSVKDVDSLVDACGLFANPESYVVEAIIHRAKEEFAPADLERIRGLRLGIHRGHPLKGPRDVYADFAANEGAVHVAAVPLLWRNLSTSLRIGASAFSEQGLLCS